MTLEILAKNKGWLYLFLSKILSEPLASELFCALQKPAAFCVKKFLRKSKSNFPLTMVKLSLDTPSFPFGGTPKFLALRNSSSDEQTIPPPSLIKR